jgi:23S rRNA (guanosine2251-2'-O)-methyltransferase
MDRQIEGRNPVYEAIKSKTKITKIFVEENKKNNNRVKKIIELALKKSIPVMFREHISSFSETKRHQGVIAYAEDVKLRLKDIPFPKLVIIVSGSDYDTNLGTLIRSAEVAGADCIILPKGTKITPHVVKSSAGATEHIPIIHDNLFNALKHLRKLGLIVYALDEKSKKPIYKANLNMPIVLIVGKEDTGVNDSLSKYVDEYVSIPMKGKISSLNMAVSASIAMFEAIRQKTT